MIARVQGSPKQGVVDFTDSGLIMADHMESLTIKPPKRQ